MPFIGKLPDVGAFRLIDSITTSATDTYALQVEGLSYFPSSARNLIVSLNGVTQAPESAYTVSGSNIIFDSALTASDVIDYILVIGESVDIGTPSDNTVGNAQLKSDLNFSGKTLTFSADQISGDAINGGTISSFASTGIDDNATSTAVTLDASGNVTVGGTTAGNAGSINVSVGSPGSTVGGLQLWAGASGSHFMQFGDVASGDGYYRGAIGYLHASDSLVAYSAGAERMRIDSNGSLKVTNSGGSTIIANRTSNPGSVELQYNGTQTAQFSALSGGGVATYVGSTPAEAMRIDASGNLLVGKTSTSFTVAGVRVRGDTVGIIEATSANNMLVLNRLTSDGDMATFYKDGTTVGSIGCASGFLYIHAPRASGGAGLGFGNSQIYPCGSTGSVEDNTTDLGIASVARFNDAYITNGVTSGSDRNDKQDIEELTEAETRVAVACKGLLRKWRWKDRVEAKDNNPDSDEVARFHFGIVAQDLKAAFEAEGLDAGRYGMFMHDTWTDEETGEERDRMGVRYSELLAFIIAAI